MTAIQEEISMDTVHTLREINWRMQTGQISSKDSAAELIHMLQTRGIPVTSIETALDGTDIPEDRRRLILLMYESSTSTLEETTQHWREKGLLN